MIRFARLFAAIDQTNSTLAKVEAMADYFVAAPPADAAWAVFFLTGRRLKRLVPGAAIREWTIAATGLDGWMLEECYAVVGDGAETAALMLDQLPAVPDEQPLSLAGWVEERILPLRQMDADDQEALVISWVSTLDRWQRLVLFKLLTGEFRLGVSQTLVVRALAQVASLPPATIAARLMGDWTPTASWFQALLSPDRTDDDLSRPYPFFLASPIESANVGEDSSLAGLLGDLQAWAFEWKWDGIRAQLVKRAGMVHLWSRGEELVTERFPEILDAAAALPDGTVLDGEVLAFGKDRPLPFSSLQQRIGRQKQVARKARDIPVVFMAYDILESAGADVRSKSWAERRRTLEDLITRSGTEGGTFSSRATQESPESREVPPHGAAEAARHNRASPSTPLLPFDAVGPGFSPAILRLSPLVRIASWDDLSRLREESRAHGVEGLMIKRRDSAYGVGRKRGDWWKWKIDPFTIDAVLIYAQPGSGKRASLLTDYTFGVWENGELVPVAKAYSGLTNEEIAEMDRWIRRHTVERFGPVRHVEPIHVFELGFEAIARSSRHRSGVAVRFPRMLRWRKDKQASDADTLESLRKMLQT
jgi:DNA ligase 1